MQTISKLELRAVELYRTLPHLPEAGRRWLSANIWWITLIGVILGGITVFSIIAATFFAGAALSVFGGVIGAAIGGIVILAVLISVGFMAVSITLGAMAVGPLKSLRRKGWQLLFVALLVQVSESLVSFIFNWNIFGLIWSLFLSGVFGYFLFEIRDLFGTPVTAAQLKVAPKTKNKTV